MKKIVVILLFVVVCTLTCCGEIVIGDKEEIITILQKTIEEAYFEGQKDALNGDVRIKKNRDGCYMWIKSPWDDKKKPIYNPNIICEQ